VDWWSGSRDKSTYLASKNSYLSAYQVQQKKCCATIITTCRTFSSYRKETPYPLSSHSPLLSPLGNRLSATKLFFAYVDLPVMDILFEWNHKTWVLGSSTFYFTEFLKVCLCYNLYQYFIPFLQLNNVPLCRYISFHLYFHH
jgi:hypothetical protein